MYILIWIKSGSCKIRGKRSVWSRRPEHIVGRSQDPDLVKARRFAAKDPILSSDIDYSKSLFHAVHFFRLRLARTLIRFGPQGW
jgi:hypothetical protein